MVDPRHYTIGPWKVALGTVGPKDAERIAWRIHGPDGACLDVAVVGDPTILENARNARLIAAAPELLAVLKAANEWRLATHGKDPWAAVRAAIAKAEGPA